MFAALMHLLALLSFAVTAGLVSLVDLKECRIPDRYLIPGTLICALALLASAVASGSWDQFNQALQAATLSSASYLVLHLASRGGIGFGDVKLATLIGLIVGWHSPTAALLAAGLAFAGAGFVAIGLLVVRQLSWQTPIPLAPFLSLAALAALALSVGASNYSLS